MDISTSSQDQLLEFFKAMADASRLKIVGLLAQKPYTVEQLSAILRLRPSTVSHHLGRLAEVGLVNARAESYYNLYQLDNTVLEKMARRLLSKETFPSISAQVDTSAFDRKVIRDYLLPDGKFKILPAQRKKLEALLGYVQQAFEPGRRLAEKQTNEILARFHEDTATLRREMIGYGLLKREEGIYWRPE